MKHSLSIVALALLVILSPTTPSQVEEWVCPPCGVDCHDEVYPRAGSCGKCGMKLVPETSVPNVAILVFQDVDWLSFAIPAGVFQTSDAAHVFTVADTADPIRSQFFQTITPQRTLATDRRIDVLVIPGGRGLVAAAEDELVLGWLKRVLPKVRCVLAVERGAWLLARAGALKDEEIAIEAGMTGRIAADAPHAKIVDRERAEAGRIFTARTSAAAAAAALDVVHALAGERKARAAADRLGFAWKPSPDRAPLPAAPVPWKKPAPARPAPKKAAPDGKAGPEEGRSYAGLDWPHWRGPARDGVSRERGWRDEGAARPVWSIDAGLGHSSVSIAGGRAYTLGFDEDAGLDTLVCVDASTGARIWHASWEATIGSRGHGGGTLTTPAVAGDRVHIASRTGELRCFGAADGKPLWHRRVSKDYGLEGTEYGFGGSPVVLDGRVYYECGAVVAVDAADGALAWKSRHVQALYATPTPFEHAGRARLAAFAKQGLFVLDRDDGAEIASVPWKRGPATVNASSPVIVDDRIFISSGYNHGCGMFRLADGALTADWRSRVLRTKLAGCALYEGHLYGFDETTLKCVDVAGAEKWRKRGFGLGALSVSDGRLLILAERGDLVVADASPAGYRERSRRKVLDGGTCWSPPVLAHGLVYCRNSFGRVVCLDHRPSP